MGSAKDRVHPRYRVDLTATARWRRTVAAVTAYDVSLTGAFIVSEEHPNARELVRLEMTLPGRPDPFSVHGMAVNFTEVGDVEAKPNGFGVQLYAMDREMQRVWAQFIDLVKRGGVARPAAVPIVPPAPPARFDVVDELPPLVIPEPLMRTPVAHVPFVRAAPVEVPAGPVGTRAGISSPFSAPTRPRPAPPPAPLVPPMTRAAPTRQAPPPSAPPIASLARPTSPGTVKASGAPGPISLRPGSSERGAVEFEVDVASIEELELFHERDASVGGMFIPTGLDLRVRSVLKVFLRHPVDGTFFELDARVSHVECDLDAPGVGVEFIGFNEAKRAGLRAFVYGAAAAPTRVAPSAPRMDAVWDFEPQAPSDGLNLPPPEDDALARLFDPWGGSGNEAQQPWSRPPPEDEFNGLFDALHEREESGLRLSRQPSMHPDEDAPDFRLSVPSWTSLEAAPSVVRLDDVVDLTDDDTIDLVEATPLPRTVDSFSRRQASRG